MIEPNADAATMKALEAQLEGMAQTTQEAEAILGSLASALFPTGDLDKSRITWPDQPLGTARSTQQDSAEARLQAAEKRFRTLVESIPAVTFMAVLGEGKNEIYVSPHIEQMLGYSQKEWLENPFLWYWRLHPDDRVKWNEEFSRGVRTGGPFRAECRFMARDGHTVWVHGEARLAKDELGRPLFLQGVAFDITDSKKAQEVLLNEAVRSARVEEELAIARRVQTSILPKNFRVPGLEIAAKMIPASQVGGDYYDVLPIQGGCWIAVGDVSGHGLNSGLIMLMVQSALAAIVRTQPGAAPRDIHARLNEVLYDNIRDRLIQDDHVTLSLLRYASKGLFMAAGAHEDILVCRKSTRKVERIRLPGTWIGARRDVSGVTVDTPITLQDGDLMVLYTDGVTEAMNTSGEQYDIDRLCDIVEASQNRTAEEIKESIFTDLGKWTQIQLDDQSIVVIRYRAGV